MIRASDIARAIFAPLTELSMLLPLLMFGGLLTLGLYRPPIGFFIVLLSLPPLFRYQSFIVEAYANARVPGALDEEYFSWFGTAWTMFPLALAIVLGYGGFRAADAWGATGMWATIAGAAAIIPASLAVLAITHSALQAMNPAALFKVFKQAGVQFFIAPAYVLVLSWLTLALGSQPLWATVFVGVFVLFSVASLTGTLIAPLRLVDNVSIPEAAEPGKNGMTGELLQLRESVLGHAYGFISRNNREGGFRHLVAAIEEDPDPAAAWDWYLTSMFLWEDKVHALFFARHYIRDALAHNEDIRAIKAALRCYRENEQFRPFPENVPALIGVAERTGNAELAKVLKRG